MNELWGCRAGNSRVYLQFYSAVSSWSTPTPHLHLGTALPAPALVGYSQASPPAPLGSVQGQPGKKALCSLPAHCPALPFYTSSSNSSTRTNGKGKASACKCSEQRQTCDLVCFADCQGKHHRPDKRVCEGTPAVIRLVKGKTALRPSANNQQMEGNDVDCKRGHAVMQCNMQLDCFFIQVC